jgi:hypothetical protein
MNKTVHGMTHALIPNGWLYVAADCRLHSCCWRCCVMLLLLCRAEMIRNAGGRVTPDVIRSLFVAQVRPQGAAS